MRRQQIDDDIAICMYIHVYTWLATARSTESSHASTEVYRRTRHGVVYIDLIRLVSSHKWQACRIEGAKAIMHVHGWSQV